VLQEPAVHDWQKQRAQRTAALIAVVKDHDAFRGVIVDAVQEARALLKLPAGAETLF
jgi:hypothetical protein